MFMHVFQLSTVHAEWFILSGIIQNVALKAQFIRLLNLQQRYYLARLTDKFM